MKKLNKSHSNPTKLHFYSPAYSGPLSTKNQTRPKTSRSTSGLKKNFGVRQIQISPISNTSRNKSQEFNKIKPVVSTIHLNKLMQDQMASQIISPKVQSTKNKVHNLNYFKSRNVIKIVNKMNGEKKKSHKNVYSQSNPFKIQPIKKLAAGQYGSIYLAISLETRFLVVLKCFNKKKVTPQFMIDQFKIQMYCRHPNILPAYGFFFGRSQAYLLMEAGTHNLYSEIKRAGCFSQHKTASYISQIMKGLAYLHLNGIIHRDIKPQNIIVCRGIPKISDFGWSIITSTQRKTFCGTLDYVSPEVAMGKLYDSKIDSWSIGVLTYEMLTGFPPYALERQDNKKRRQQGQNPKLNYKAQINLPCTISQQGANFIKKMLCFDPKKRPSVVEGLRDEWLSLYSRQKYEEQKYIDFNSLISRQ